MSGLFWFSLFGAIPENCSGKVSAVEWSLESCTLAYASVSRLDEMFIGDAKMMRRGRISSKLSMNNRLRLPLYSV